MTANVWNPNARTVTQANANGTFKEELLIAESGQRTFNITTFAYALGTGSLIVFKNGEILSRNLDYIETSTTQILLTVGATAGDKLLICGFVGITGSAATDTVLRADLASEGGSNLVGYLATPTGSVPTTIKNKVGEVKSIFDFLTSTLITAVRTGVYSDANRVAMLAALTAAWTSAIGATPHDLFFPKGKYSVKDANFPFKQAVGVLTLLDCKDVTVYCEGPATVFETVSSTGADVLQLNRLKNFHVKGFPTLTATLTATLNAGSNGVSVTNGWDNLTLEIVGFNLPSIDKGSYVDGGKALTLQPDVTSNECGTLVAKVRAKGCAEGFGYEVNLVTAAARRAAVTVDLEAESCYVAAKVVAGAATGAISAGTTLGLILRGHSINCQVDAILNRAHGVSVELQVITTSTEAARRLSPAGIAWFAADTTVESLVCAYAHHSRIIITGDKGACAYKARIGGASAGSSGLSAQTRDCEIYLDLGGTASVANIFEIDSGGNTMGNCILYVSAITSATLPTVYYAESLTNTLSIGPSNRFVTSIFSGTMKLQQGATGAAATGEIDIFGPSNNITCLRGQTNGTANTPVAGLADNAGTVRLGIINGNGLMIDGITSGSAVGAYLGKWAVYNTSGVFIGWLPLYN